MKLFNSLLITTALCSPAAFSQTVEWFHSPGENVGQEKIVELEIDILGNSFIVGNVSDTTDMDPSTVDLIYTPFDNNGGLPGIDFIQKLDLNGNLEWTHGWESTSNGSATDVQDMKIMDNQYIFVTGWFQGDLGVEVGPNADTLISTYGTNSYIFKFDMSGNFLEKAQYDNSPNATIAISAMEIDGNEDLIVSGSITGSQNMTLDGGTPVYLTSAGYKDCFIAKYDENLQLIWAKRYGGSFQEDVQDIAIDHSGNIISTGDYQSTSNDFDPGSGNFSLTHTNSGDGFIQKLDNDGNFIWAKSVASTGYISVQELAIGPNNGIYSVGIFGDAAFDYPNNSTYIYSDGNSDAYVWAVDSNGVTNWIKNISGNNTPNIKFIKLDGNTIALGGQIFPDDSTNIGSTLIPYYLDTVTTGFVASYDLLGNLQTTYELKDGYSDISDAEFGLGNMFAAGDWTNTTDFNAGPAVDSYQSDYFLDFFLMRVSPTSVSLDENGIEMDYLVYPNPVLANQEINFNGDYTRVEVYSTSGQLVQNGKKIEPIQNPGIYIVRFHTETGMTSKKLIVR